MFIAPAFAQDGGAGSPNFIIQMLPFLLIFAIIYFLILRPQQKKMKDHREMVGSLRRGDTVVTSGGLIGKVTKVADDELLVELAKDMRVKVVRSTISDVRAKGEPAKDADK